MREDAFASKAPSRALPKTDREYFLKKIYLCFPLILDKKPLKTTYHFFQDKPQF